MDAENRVANFDPATGQLYYAQDGSLEDRALVKPDRNNVGPRLGIVYKASNTTVVRGGYGIYYNLVERIGSKDQLSLNPPGLRNISITVPAGSAVPAMILRNGFPPNFLDVSNINMLEHAFTVPSGVARLDVALDHNTGKDRRTVIDLGLRSPSGLRGWSGGRESRVHVSTLTATQGYLPGPIEPGRCTVILGVPNIRQGSRDSYSVTITFEGEPLRGAAPLRAEYGWYAGDLHLHSGHSDGRGRNRSGASVQTPVHRVLDTAAASGLDFAVLSDHNTGAHWLDIDRLQPYYDTLLLLHGREVTTYRGHANAVGEKSLTDFTLATPATALRPLLRRVTREGAFLSINHPLRPDDESCMGCGWSDSSLAILRSVHGVEAVNGEDWKTSTYGWPFWADALNRGARLALVGGSDDHTPDDTSDIRPGTPTTVVFASALSEPALVEGLKAGRTYVRVRDPGGPSIEFTAMLETGIYEMGDTIFEPLSSISLAAVVTGAAGQTLQWIRSGVPVKTVTIDEEGVMGAHIKARPGDWFSVVIGDEHGPTLLTSAIYTE